ncbi:MAG: isoprenyl transferase [Ectothiorhodospiraceae bacterium]|nr:isoprenyl transferase [Ectothiorhodospiraceae bacterium]MCH8504536.1 isoprenyl transferase [Ectothiorhodospiraceae bacterium]
MSSEQQIEPGTDSATVPKHVAIVMDGNGRWAQARFMPRPAGHRAGVEAVRKTVEACGRRGVRVLTLFAFSSENWSRPADEVSVLMDLFLRTLEKEAGKLHENDVRIRLIGDRHRLGERLRRQVERVEQLTADNSGLTLVIAASYGGRWDMVEAARRLAEAARDGNLDPASITEDSLSGCLSTAGLPDPDLLIRTGGERRISNFLLWQLAYAELYFSPTLWPDFGVEDLDEAFAWYAGRERRFGQTSAQLEQAYRA